MTQTDKRYSPVWVELSRANLEYNWKEIHAVVGPTITVIPMLKSNGYGHGAVQIGRELQRLGTKYAGVTSVPEVIELRQAGITIPLFIADYVDPENIAEAVAQNATLTISDNAMLPEIEKAAQSLSKKIPVQVNIDTGMHREGVWPTEEAVRVVKRVHESSVLELEGIFTHFATAGDADTSFVEQQLAVFNHCLDMIQAASIPLPRYIHAAEGAGVMRFPHMHKDDPHKRITAVRPGNIIYGLPPGDSFPFLFPPRRVLVAIKAKLAGIKTVNKGETVGYGRTWTAAQDNTTLGIVTSGYTDSLRRILSNKGHMLIHGEEAPIVGLISMNQTVLHLPHPKDHYALGDEVIIVGKQGEKEITLEQLSEGMQTIMFEYLATLNPVRLPRIFVDA